MMIRIMKKNDAVAAAAIDGDEMKMVMMMTRACS